VYVAAAGPPARLYGVSTKGGSRQWEYKLPQSSATLAGLAGSSDDNRAQRGTNTVFMAVNQPSSNSSWVQALGLGSGKVVWQSAALNGTLLGGLELQESARVLLATNVTGDGLVGLDAGNGSLLWSRSGRFCKMPSLAAGVLTLHSRVAAACRSPSKQRSILMHGCSYY
jgi:outer membrane protein assembly factor BamB